MSDVALAHPVAGRSVLVAGASGGIGSAMAAELDRRGATLTLVGRDPTRLDTVPADGRRATIDLRTEEGCRAAVEAAVDHAGRLDVVVNAVGVVAFGPVTELSVDAMEELFLPNTFVPIMLARAALPALAQGGALVSISGLVAEANVANMVAYGASKAAVRSFDEGLARELRTQGVRVLDARPPHTRTGLADRPLEGHAPRMPHGIEPAQVAAIICDALEQGVADLPSSAFSTGGGPGRE